MDAAPIIAVDNLTKSFRVLRRQQGRFGALRTFFSADYEEVRAVSGVSFAVAPGEVVGYLGPNGAGKSTTIKMLTGILHPSGGRVVVAGLVPHQQRTRNAQNIGVIFGQRTQLIWSLSPRDSFTLLRKIYAVPADRFAATLARFTDLLDLEEILDRPVRLLSLGQRMRCELVASLLHEPQIIYLDEPTIGLDLIAKERIREFILTLNREQGTTVLLTTHDLSDVEKLCRRVIVIDKRTVICDDTLAGLKHRFDHRRTITFSCADGDEPPELVARLVAIDGVAEVGRREDGAITVGFDPQRLPVAEMTRLIVNSYPVADLAVGAVDIEAIVRDIYAGGSAAAGR